MGLFTKDYCACCGNKIEQGIKCLKCDKWICGICLLNKSTRKKNVLFADTMICPNCSQELGYKYDAIINKLK